MSTRKGTGSRGAKGGAARRGVHAAGKETSGQMENLNQALQSATLGTFRVSIAKCLTTTLARPLRLSGVKALKATIRAATFVEAYGSSIVVSPVGWKDPEYNQKVHDSIQQFRVIDGNHRIQVLQIPPSHM